MITVKTPLRLLGACGIIVAASGWGCLSMQSQTSIDNVADGGASQPYVEGYVEYAGPQSKWAGPASFILHVAAKDAGDAQITTTPALLSGGPAIAPPANEPPTVTQRNPAASVLSQAGNAPSLKRLTSTEAREQLARLATALQGGTQAPFHGCMSPVRVRLVRADGGILERQGCRSELGWSRVVSESVSQFIEASWRGNEHGAPAPAPAPASAPESTQKPATQTRNDLTSKRPARSVAAVDSGNY